MSELTVGILVFDGVEVLDFCGPFEVFSVTRRAAAAAPAAPPGGAKPEAPPHDEPPPPAFRVVIVAETTSRPVTTTGGMKVHAGADYESCPRLDVLVVPGGLGTRSERHKPETRQFVLRHVPNLAVLASVCTGSLILCEAGLLDGRTATTHWKALDLMEQEYPKVRVVRNKHWVRVEADALQEPGPGAATQGSSSGPAKLLYSSAGISAGIDMSLKIVEELLGEATARATALHMEYPYPESDERRVPTSNV